ncbi:MAG: hypothetical protein GXP31_17580 [Kiritimatiellaeota bacterium]|nr:hypothetical protein [Kiritimatiellota bacterium]
MYIEQSPKKNWPLGILLAFVLLYLPNLGVREFRTGEAVAATVAWEMCRNGDFLSTTVYGRHVDAFPLASWLISATSLFERPNEWTARLPSALAILGIAAMAGFVAARANGHLAGAVAAGMVLTAPVCLSAGVQAGSDAVFAFIIVAAWFSWYRLGRIEKRWSLAWTASLLLVAVAAFGWGARAFLYFYFPLFFLRRPLRFSVRSRTWGHFVGLAVAAIVIGSWLFKAPHQVFFPWEVLVFERLPRSTTGYFTHLLGFPIECALFLFPWPLLAWPGFCAAFRPLERTPVLCRYLRVLSIPLFLLVWLLPDLSPKALLPLIGPLAVLTGVHYPILVRRYHRKLERLHHYLAVSALYAGGVGLTFAVFHATGLLVIDGLQWRTWSSSVLLVAVATGTALYQTRHLDAARPFWVRLLVSITALRLIFLAVYPPVHSVLHGRRRTIGTELAAAVPAGATVYKHVARRLVSECFYMDRPVREVRGIQDIPASERQTAVLFVLDGARYPILDLNNRNWRPCSAAVDLRTRAAVRLSSTPPGKRGLFHVTKAFRTPSTADDAAVVRMYRGELRPPDERLPAAPPPPDAVAPGP